MYSKHSWYSSARTFLTLRPWSLYDIRVSIFVLDKQSLYWSTKKVLPVAVRQCFCTAHDEKENFSNPVQADSNAEPKPALDGSQQDQDHQDG